MGNADSSPLNSGALDLVLKTVLPELGYTHHKGQHGRVAVIGGSFRFSGAPFYAAQTSLVLGCDLATVFCPKNAASVIKSYSPALIVDPQLPDQQTVFDLRAAIGSTGSSPADAIARHASCIDAAYAASVIQAAKKAHASGVHINDILINALVAIARDSIIARVKECHAIVVGPGLGKDVITCEATTNILEAASLSATPIVLDAEGIALLTNAPISTTLRITEGFENMIVTTNAPEFRRLCEQVGVDTKLIPSPSEKRMGDMLKRLQSAFSQRDDAWVAPAFDKMKDVCYSRHAFILTKLLHSKEALPAGYEDFEVLRAFVQVVHEVAKKLGGPTIVLKGVVDIVVNKYHAVVVAHPGAPKRCGGLGDILAGAIAGFAAFFHVKNMRVYACYEEPPMDVKLLLEDDTINSAVLGCITCKAAQYKAFQKKGRAMVSSDVLEEVGDILTLNQLSLPTSAL